MTVERELYAGAEGLCALVCEDVAIGGPAGTSSRIEDYMGFPTGVSGADLLWRGEMNASSSDLFARPTIIGPRSISIPRPRSTPTG